MIDLERFKNINDSFGQLAGDELLRQVAQWLRHNVHDELLLARISADHFAAVLPEVAKSGDLARLIETKLGAFQEHPFGPE
jgi:diguanylate cyclase (GGDEF)-like protein